MSIKHRSPIYRIVGITLAFVVAGVALFVPLIVGIQSNRILVWILLGVYVAAYLTTVIVNEIVIRKRYPDYQKSKREEDE